MKILLLSPRLPLAFGKADSMTVFHLIRFLSRRHEVYLACFYSKSEELQHVQELKNMCKATKFLPLRKRKSLLNMARTVPFGAVPLQVAYYQDRRMQRVVDQMLEQYRPDLAYAHLIRMGEYLRYKTNPKRILAMQISQTLNYRRMLDNISSPFYKILYKLEYNRIRRYEPMVSRSFDSCLLISKHDAQSFDSNEEISSVFYSPHGIDIEYYKRTKGIEREKAILFCGVLETPTNMDAVLFFYKDIYPLIKHQVPDVAFYIVGRNPPACIRRIAEGDSSVVVTGTVEDVRPYYAKARVGIDPLRIGAGLQNKLLVGMCMELPMVCTSIANEGIAAKDRKHLIVADTPREFGTEVVDLLKNADKATNIARQARAFVEKEWTWEYHLAKLERYFSIIVSEPAVYR